MTVPRIYLPMTKVESRIDSCLGRHDELIRRLCKRDNRVRTRRFLAETLEAVGDPAIMEGLGEMRRRPDAYLIDPEECAVIMWEVVVTHDLDDGKLREYSALWWELDCNGWHLGLVRMGPDGAEEAVDLGGYYYDWLVAALQARSEGGESCP